MTEFYKTKVGNEIIEKSLSMWQEINIELMFSKHDNDTEIKKVPIIKPIKTGREKHIFGKQTWQVKKECENEVYRV